MTERELLERERELLQRAKTLLEKERELIEWEQDLLRRERALLGLPQPKSSSKGRRGSKDAGNAVTTAYVSAAYDRLVEKYGYREVKIHELRERAGLAPEIFDNTIKQLARNQKIDLLTADPTLFTLKEREDSYWDAEENTRYYYLRWR